MVCNAYKNKTKANIPEQNKKGKVPSTANEIANRFRDPFVHTLMNAKITKLEVIMYTYRTYAAKIKII